MTEKSWIVFGLLSAFFAALIPIFTKLGLKSVDTTLATTIRAVVMALFLVLVSFAMHKTSGLGAVNGRALFYIVLAGLAGALSWLAYFYALKSGPVKGVAVLDRSSVIMAILLAALVLGEAITVKNWIGMILIALGALLFIF